jgi:hypothetical protein
MSQLSKAITAVDTGERKYTPQKSSPLFQDVFSAKAEIQDTCGPDLIGKVYRIGCRIGSQAVVSEYDLFAHGSSPLEEAITRTKRQVIEGVFGEFRPHIRRIEKAIYDYDYNEAGRLLHEMERVMYEPE